MVIQEGIDSEKAPTPHPDKFNQRERKHSSEYSDTNSEQYDDQYAHWLSDESDEEASDKISFPDRHQRPKKPDRRVIFPANPERSIPMNFRYFQLLQQGHRPRAKNILEVNQNLRAPVIILNTRILDGEDPTKIFDFPARLLKKPILIRCMKRRPSKCSYGSLRGQLKHKSEPLRGSCTGDGVSCWPMTIQFPLST